MRIAVAGLQHETNTFVGGVTDACAFAKPGGWPELVRGAALCEGLAGTSVPLAGALAVLADRGADVVPLVWAAALPSGPVDHRVFEAFRQEIVDGLSASEPVDGVFVELHGAMVTTAEPDAEGNLLEALRRVLGPTVPLVATLDLHGNVTARMVANADWIEPYRTYPHVDMPETGKRAARRLLDLASGEDRRPARAFRPVPFLLPLVAQATDAPEVAALFAAARAQERATGVLGVQLTMGFPYADIADAGPAIIVYAESDQKAEDVADAHLALWIAAETLLHTPLIGPDEAVAKAMDGAGPDGPVILADVQDNPGGGGTQDTTGLLKALVEAGAHGAVLTHICDAPAAATAHSAGCGATLDMTVGGRASPEHGAPVEGPFEVVALGSGRFTGEGPMYCGNAIDLGPVALLRKGGIDVVVAGRRMQASEPGLLRHLGLDPACLPILAVKSSVHFRGAYQLMARDIILVDAPGAVTMSLEKLDFRHALRPVARAAPYDILGPTGDAT